MHGSNIPFLKDARVPRGTRVLVRVDFNVPIENGEVRDAFRIERSYKTINFLREKGAKIILISHIESVSTLKPVSQFLNQSIPHIFISDFRSENRKNILQSMQEGDVVLLENLRLDPGEKANDEIFAKTLADLADLYVNDAFSVSHRAHASIVGVPRFLPGYAGFLLEEEIRELSKALDPEKPLLFILGGAKFETKLPLIKRFQGIADTLIIGGALANDIYKAKDLNVGDSLVSGDADLTFVLNDKRIIAPSEVLVKRGEETVTTSVESVMDNDIIVDASLGWIESVQGLISTARTILWNGPLGKYESGGAQATVKLAECIAKSNAYSIVGGGDTLAAISENKLEEKFSFISTGGGAMLDFLGNGTLPGIEALGEVSNTQVS